MGERGSDKSITKKAKPVEPANAQDERRICAAIDSPVHYGAKQQNNFYLCTRIFLFLVLFKLQQKLTKIFFRPVKSKFFFRVIFGFTTHKIVPNVIAKSL